MTDGNLFAGPPAGAAEELFTDLAARAGVRIERIVSTGQSTTGGDWYDQAWDV